MESGAVAPELRRACASWREAPEVCKSFVSEARACRIEKATGRSAQVRRLRTLANRVARQRRAELHHRYLRYAVSSTVGIDLKPGFAKK